jgi:ferrous iron transport protein B
MMNPFMSCGARLPVYALFAAAFFPENGQLIVFILYGTGILAAILTGLVLRHTLLKGTPSPFVMELPPYRWPTLQSISIKSWERLKGFILNAGKLIVPMVLILNILNTMGTDGSFDHADQESSVLSQIGQTLTPIFQPMGIEPGNWPATVGIFTGILAKEAVVGSLNALYSQMLDSTLVEQEESFDLTQSLFTAWQTIPDNLMTLTSHLLDPLGLDLGDLSDKTAVAERQKVKQATYSIMQSHFPNTASAFAYLLFILLYAPCVAATAAIYKETHAGWALFIICWTTGIAYLSASTFYQIATIEEHPSASINWIMGCLLALSISFLSLRWKGNRMIQREK